jgi:hypothetical protein
MTGEKLLHEQFIAYLRKLGLVWSRSRMDRATTSENGHPDFTVYGPQNRVCFVEFKIRPNRLSDAQTCRVAALQRAGCQVCIAYDLETAIHHLATTLFDSAPEPPPAAPPEPKFYLVNSSVGLVVIKENGKDVEVVRPATAEDIERIPPRPIG